MRYKAITNNNNNHEIICYIYFGTECVYEQQVFIAVSQAPLKALGDELNAWI
jgi:hypothetical protein